MSAAPTVIRLFRLWIAAGLPEGIWFVPAEGPDVAEYTGTYELRKLHAVYNHLSSAGGGQDVRITTHHFLNLTGGSPDATWADADYAQVETAFTAMWTAIKSLYAPAIVLQELRWYGDGPAFKPFGTSASPMLRALTVAAPGTATGGPASLPPQAAISVTEVTAARYSTVAREGRPSQLRHRWGRFYLPPPSFASLGVGTSDGRIAAAAQTTIANAAQAFYNACRAGLNLIPVMYSPTTGNAWSVDEIHVDDIWDVVRSRRFETPISRAVRTLTQMLELLAAAGEDLLPAAGDAGSWNSLMNFVQLLALVAIVKWLRDDRNGK